MQPIKTNFSFGIDEAIKMLIAHQLNSLREMGKYPVPIMPGHIDISYHERGLETDSNNLSHANAYVNQLEITLKDLPENYQAIRDEWAKDWADDEEDEDEGIHHRYS